MKKIRLSKSCIGNDEKANVVNVLDHEFLGMGKDVQLFEQEIKSYIETSKEVICTSTGTAALHLAILCLEIGPGDEVLVPSLTYVASFQAISATGASPIACDVNEETLFIDIRDAESRITKQTKAIMPVHYASNSKEINVVYELANKYNLRVIEDAAHSFGCIRDNKKVGCEGDIICFSFDGIKNITSGEGGAILTSDQKLAQRIKDARLLGVERDSDSRYQHKRTWLFDVSYQGFRYHMSNIMAAIGRAQLAKIELMKQERQRIVDKYLKELIHLEHINFLDFHYENNMSHIFVVKIKNNYRDELRTYLSSQNIETGIHYPPNHLLTKYKTVYSLPTTENAFTETLTLPCHPDLSVEQQEEVIHAICEFFNKSKK